MILCNMYRTTCGPQRKHFPPIPLLYRHTTYSRTTWRRCQSSQAVLQVRPVSPSARLPLPRTGLIAVEQVDGRARHLSWSDGEGIKKEWRELAAVDADTGETTVSTKASRGSKITSWLRQMFLPTNYPQSVHRSYLPYHGLQFVEAILGTLVSVLCNQALLVSVGVSAEGSIFGAVAVQWIIKDGAGELAKLFFIRKYSSFFDSHPKTFNLIGAANVLFGSGLQIASLIVPSTATYFLLCAAGGNVFKMIGGAFWFTTHIKFVRCFAQQGNTGDVAAKSESQASIGQLLGYAAGIGLLAVSHSAPYLYSIFALTVPAHLAVTAWMLRVATFELLTLPRLSHLADEFVGNREVVSLKQLEAEKKTGLFGEFYKRKENAYVSLTPRLEDIITTDSLKDRRIWDACMHAFDREPYLLYPARSSSHTQTLSVFYHPSAAVDDMIRSVLHAACLRSLLKLQEDAQSEAEAPAACSRDLDLAHLYAALEKSNRWTKRHFDEFKFRLQDNGWRTDEIAFADRGRRVLWGSATS